jgi:hypothetical protein
MKKIDVKACNQEILLDMMKIKCWGDDYHAVVKDMGFYEFTLTELNLPPAEKILESVLQIKDEVGIQDWRSNGVKYDIYQGFSLTYNPDFIEDKNNIYHQTLGSYKLSQSFSRKNGKGQLQNGKNTYYDSFAFRKIPPIVKNNLSYLFKCFNLSLLRSRVSWSFGKGLGEQKRENWHIDEPPIFLMRINIPLQTSEEHVIDIVGEDEFGNKLNIVNKHLEVGKVYIWNTRIPHRITLKRVCNNPNPRIHMVLGFSPWFDYNEDTDSFIQNNLWGESLDNIVKNKLFLKKSLHE